MSKRIILPRNLFLEADIEDPNIKLRFRLISENRNSISAWSSIFSINPKFIYVKSKSGSLGKIHLQKSGDVVNISWDSVSVNKYIDDILIYLQELSQYDIWIKWAGTGGADPSDWIYKERISSTSLNINIPSSYVDSTGVTRLGNTIKYMYIEIYRIGRPVSRFQDIDSFIQDSISVDITNDTIFFEEGQEYATSSSVVYTSATPITGLTSGSTYYVRVVGPSRISLHPTELDAFNNTNKINLSGTPSGTGTITGYPLQMYSALITTL